MEHVSPLQWEEPWQEESFRVQEQEDAGWNQVPQKSERGQSIAWVDGWR